MPPQIDAFRFWTNTVKVLFLTMIKDYEAHACIRSHFVLIFAGLRYLANLYRIIAVS